MIEHGKLIAAVFGLSSIEASDSKHPNEMKFKGVLVRLDEASTKPPNGSRGHKILIPKALAQRKLNTLLGMGVNYAVDLEKHQPTRKVGVIKKAWIEGNAVHVSGVIWKKDFPDAEKDLKQPNLGMSFEASDISVEDMSADIWRLSDLCFTGAAILYKASAAYYKTEALAASASMSVQLIKTNDGGNQMAIVGKKKNIAASGVNQSDLVAALTAAMAPLTTTMNVLAEGQRNLADVIEASMVENVSAKAKKAMKDDNKDDEDDDEDADDMDAEDEEASADVEDEEASADDEDELEDLDSDLADDDQTPGKLNSKIVKNKGSKTTVSVGREKHKSVSASALAQLSEKVDALIEASAAKDRTISKLRKQVTASAAQIEAAGERTDRKSIGSHQLQALLAKEGIDSSTMSASGEKLGVAEFDAMLDKGQVSVTQRIAIKQEAAKLGVMDEGHLVRR